MFRTFASIALLCLSVTACAREASPPPAEPAKTPAAQTAPPAQPQAGAESRAAAAAQETTGDASPEDRSDAALEHLAALPAAQQLPSGDRLKPGMTYKPLSPAQPTSVPAGKIEVVEVFWYGCPHCNALEPLVESWLKTKPEYIEFVRVPVIWGPVHRAHARLFYTLQALNRSDLTQKVFDTIHHNHNMLVAKDDEATRKLQSDFAGANGIDPRKFLDAWNSFGVNSNLQRAEELTQRYQVEGVPEFIVNGKYKTDVGMAGGQPEVIAVVDALAASERHH